MLDPDELDFSMLLQVCTLSNAMFVLTLGATLGRAEKSELAVGTRN